ncbi:hypothetical protein [uncultured Williamsia sp.]|uniref:hypothetical protein n=1 Tax=uncultured Williamsia sp. TaxID=259311 RepID=UPI00262D0B86|nr:hypothetical protein [uncultured Williamsia sp.]
MNSTKDMTGVVTTLSDHDSPRNPYFDLIPNVCAFLPDSLTKDRLGMAEKNTGFAGKHSLLQLCNMATTSGPNYEQLGLVVTIQATSIADVSSNPEHRDIDKSVPVWRNVTGVLYKNPADDTQGDQVCNLAWGTFYGSAVVTVSTTGGYKADPCSKAREFSAEIAPYLPSRPVQMRPSEG